MRPRLAGEFMRATVYHLDFEGAILERGFWVYVWKIVPRDGHLLYYVGKTGDKASGVSQSAFDRLSKHVGHNKYNNALRRHLSKAGIDPATCRFTFHAWGPLFHHSARRHRDLCDVTSALEKGLADSLVAGGYSVINRVTCRTPLDEKLFADLRSAFIKQFPKLGRGTDH